MKKMFCLLLSVLMVVGLFAGCSKEKKNTLQVGYARVDISPYDASLPMRGYGDEATRYSTGVADPIYTTCTAFRDGEGNTILLFHNDLIASFADPIGFARRDISKATGIPVGNIMVAATHTHHGPGISNTNNDPAIEKYNKNLREWMLEAAKAAIADLKDAKMYISSVETEGLNFTRHYIMNDGTVAGDNFGSHKSGYAGHVRKADPVMQLVKFTREGAKDVILANFQTHPHRAGGGEIYTKITADLVGTMRDNIEPALNCNFAYFTGASGDVNPSSRIAEENAAKDYIEQGKMLSDYAVKASQNWAEASVGKVQILPNTFKAEPKEGVKGASDIQQYAFSIGEVAFIMAPYEMFNENGEQIKNGSPFKMTFVCTLANDQVRYIPSTNGYDYNGLLSYGANVTRYAKGTGDALAAKYVEMLTELYKTK